MSPPPPFEVLMPEVESRSRRHFSHLRAAAQDEAVAESVAQAWGLYCSAIARGNHRFTPFTLALYASRAVASGRRFAGYKKSDALDHGAVGFDDLDAEGQSRIARALIQRQTPVFDQARIRIDWPDFLRLELTERERDVVTRIAEGSKRSEIARYLGVVPSRVTQILGEVAESYVEMFGLPGFEHRARKQEKRKPGRKSRRLRAVA